METPPDSGTEERLDEVAALLWAMEHEHVTDPGACRRVRENLRSLEREVGDHRRSEVERAAGRWPPTASASSQCE